MSVQKKSVLDLLITSTFTCFLLGYVCSFHTVIVYLTGLFEAFWLRIEQCSFIYINPFSF